MTELSIIREVNYYVQDQVELPNTSTFTLYDCATCIAEWRPLMTCKAESFKKFMFGAAYTIMVLGSHIPDYLLDNNTFLSD